MEEILVTINKLNPWYKSKKVPDHLYKPYIRREFEELYDSINNTEFATLLIGGRRVGKSILIFQLIQKLLDSGVDPKHILFIQGDNTILRECDSDGLILNKVISTYEKYVLYKDFSSLEESDQIYIFVDEAQALPKWDTEIKSTIDYKYPIKFFISGSSSDKLRKGAQTPLVGRVEIMTLNPFSFEDFISFEYKEDELKKIHEFFKTYSSIFFDELVTNKYETILRNKRKLENFSKKYDLKNKFNDYLFFGGYPYVNEHKKNNDIQKYLRDILTMTYSRDISDIRDPQAFERLLVNICKSISCPLKHKTLADTIGIDERTINKYIDYYLNTHFIYETSPHAFFNKQNSVKAEKKVYLNDSGMINTLLFKSDEDIKNDKAYCGVLVENLVHNQLLNFKRIKSGVETNSIPFWVEQENRKEIDFILEIQNTVIPIEVKFKHSISHEDTTCMQEFFKKRTSVKSGIVVTESLFEIRENILFIPAHIFSIFM